MFSKAKIGDRVWTFNNGWGTIVSIECKSVYSLNVNFDNGEETSYTIGGKFSSSDSKPSLFWDEIKFEIPSKPKRIVKKWIALFWHDDKKEWRLSGTGMVPDLYTTLKAAKESHIGSTLNYIYNEIEVEE